jgi:hypothetical protein
MVPSFHVVLGLPTYRPQHSKTPINIDHRSREDEPHEVSLIRQCEPFKADPPDSQLPQELQDIKEKVLAHFSALGRRPRVAVILGQKLRGYIPEFHSERMQRLSDFLHGSDIFIAVPDQDSDMVQYLPESLMVAVSSWKVDVNSFDPAQREDPALQSNFQGWFTQLLRTQDAFQMIEQHEKESGWEYDVVVRVRPEVVHTNICDMGIHQGCAAKGAWPLAVSAHILAEENPFMGVRHDANYGGRRSVMKKAMDNVQAHLEQKLGIIIKRRLTCKSDSPKICSQDVSVTAAKNRKFVGDAYTGHWQENVLHVVNNATGLPERGLGGMNIRRFGYDHYGSDKMGPDYPIGFLDGCRPYPPIRNSTPPPTDAAKRIFSSGADMERAAQIDSEMFAEYVLGPGSTETSAGITAP